MFLSIRREQKPLEIENLMEIASKEKKFI